MWWWLVGFLHKPLRVPACSTPYMTFTTSLKEFFGSSPPCPVFLGISEAVRGSGSLPLSQAAVSPLCHWWQCLLWVLMTWHRSGVPQSAHLSPEGEEELGELRSVDLDWFWVPMGSNFSPGNVSSWVCMEGSGWRRWLQVKNLLEDKPTERWKSGVFMHVFIGKLSYKCC